MSGSGQPCAPAPLWSGLWPLLGLAPTELPKTLWLGLNLALACLLLMLLRALTTALFLASQEASLLPWLFAASALFFTLISTLDAALMGRISRKLQIQGLQGIFLLALVLGWLALESGMTWASFGLYVVLQSLAELLMIEAGILQNAALNPREARRLQPLINAMGTLGALAGGGLAIFLPLAIGVESSLLLVVGLLALMMLTSHQLLWRYTGSRTEAKAKSRQGPRTRSALAGFLQDRLVLFFLLLMLAYGLASTLVDFQFKSLLKLGYDKEAMAAFLGLFYALLNLATLLVQIFVNSPFLRHFGLVGGLVLLPLVLILGSGASVFIPLFAVVVLMRFMEQLVSYSVFKDASGLLSIALSPLEQGRLNILARGLIRPLGILTASLLLYWLGEGLGFRGLALVILLMSALAAFCALKLGKPYRAALTRAMSDRRLRLQPRQSLALLGGKELESEVKNQLEQADPDKCLLVLELIREQGLTIDPQLLLPWLSHPDARIRQALFDALEQLKPTRAWAVLHKRLTEAKGPERALLLRLLRRLGDVQRYEIATAYSQDADWRVRGQALAILASDQDGVGRQALFDSLKASDCTQEAAALLAAGELQFAEAMSSIERHLGGPDPLLQEAALTAAMALNRLELADSLIGQLANPSHRQALLPALKALGKPVIPRLIQGWKDAHNTQVRRTLLGLLADMSSSAAGLALVQLLAKAQWSWQPSILRALVRHLGKRQMAPAEKSIVQDLIEQGLARAQLEQGLLALVSADRERFIPERKLLLEEELRLRLVQQQERLLSLLGLLLDSRRMRQAWYNYRSGDPRLKAMSLEWLETSLPERWGRPLLALLEPSNGHDTVVTPNNERPCPFPSPQPQPSPRGRGGERALCDFQAKPAQAAKSQALMTTLGRVDGWLQQLAAFAMANPALAFGANAMNQAQMPHIERIFFLKTVPIFSGLMAQALEPLAEAFGEQSLAQGSRVFSQGEVGDAFYLLVHGRLGVEHDGKRVTTLGPGDAFGEMALLDDEVRSASLIALEDVELLRLDRDSFQDALEEYPEIARGVLQVISRRLRTALEGPIC